MNKRFFALVLISVMLIAGGCGSSSHAPITSTTDVNSALKGAWTSSTSGAATIADTTESEELEALIAAFGIEDIPDELKDEYTNAQDNEIEAPVTKAMAVFEDCNVAETSGTAKLTAIVILSGDSSFLPIVFNGVTLTTQRSDTNEWTATVLDGTLTMKMSDEETMTLSGEGLKYLGYVCDFSTTIEKNPSNSMELNEILNDSSWSLDEAQGGGYLASGSEIIAAAAPEAVSIFFSGIDSQPSVNSFYSLRTMTSSTESLDETSLLQSIAQGKGTLTNICDDVYRFEGDDGIESIIFVENTDKILVFLLASEENYESCMFLPLTKETVDLKTALSTKWKATEGMGGGYANFNDEVLKDLGAFSFSLKSATLEFSDVPTVNDDDDNITATVALNTSLSFSNKILEDLGLSADDMAVSITETPTVEMTRSGNFLEFIHDGDTYKLSFISNTEAFLSITPDPSEEITGEFVINFVADN